MLAAAMRPVRRRDGPLDRHELRPKLEAGMNSLRYFVIGIVGVAAAAAQAPVADLNDLGNQAVNRRDFPAAESYYRQAIAEFRASGPNYEAHLAASLFNLGTAACAEGKRAEGARYYEEALALHRRSLGPKHLRTMTNVNRMAVNYLMLGEVERAETLYAEALPIERELYPNDVQLAHTLGGLAAVRLRQGQTADVLPLAEEALEVARKAAGDSSVDTAQMYANVGEIHRSFGRADRALPLYRKARFILEKALGPADPRVLSILSQEGLILMSEGKLTLAEQALNRALEGFGKSCPLCVPEVSIAENNLGLLRLKQKRYADADQLLSHVLTLQEKYMAKPSREMADTLHNLSVVREKEQLHADAVRLQNRATMILGLR
jgi:tetratricopeptide (TPR) repeat protein